LEVTVKDDALKWLRQFLGMSSALVLNVAGPRESKAPGIQARAKALIEKHIRLSGNRGVPIKEFLELLSGTPSRRVRYFFDQMRVAGTLRSEGRGRGALWFLIGQK